MGAFGVDKQPVAVDSVGIAGDERQKLSALFHSELCVVIRLDNLFSTHLVRKFSVVNGHNNIVPCDQLVYIVKEFL